MKSAVFDTELVTPVLLCLLLTLCVFPTQNFSQMVKQQYMASVFSLLLGYGFILKLGQL